MSHVAGHPAGRRREDHPGGGPGRSQRRSGRLNASAVSLVDRALTGDRNAVARLISLVEKGAPDLPRSCRSSSLTRGMPSPSASRERRGPANRQWSRPSSRRSGGKAIAWRCWQWIRRPLQRRCPARRSGTDAGPRHRRRCLHPLDGGPGPPRGLALAAPEAIRILDAAGAAYVLVETVGVGQSEIEVMHAADTTVVVVTPRWGDGIQAGKAGLLEIGDISSSTRPTGTGAGRLCGSSTR